MLPTNQCVQLCEQLEIVCRARLLPGRCTLRVADNSFRPSCELIYAESTLRNFRTLLRLCRGINQSTAARRLPRTNFILTLNLTSGWLRGASHTSSTPRPPEFVFGLSGNKWGPATRLSQKLAQSHQKFMAKSIEGDISCCLFCALLDHIMVRVVGKHTQRRLYVRWPRLRCLFIYLNTLHVDSLPKCALVDIYLSLGK